jgi:hypothetical protein
MIFTGHVTVLSLGLETQNKIKIEYPPLLHWQLQIPGHCSEKVSRSPSQPPFPSLLALMILKE